MTKSTSLIVSLIFILGLSITFFVAGRLQEHTTPEAIGKYTVHTGAANGNKTYQTDAWYRSDGLIVFTDKATGHRMTATTCNVPFVENNYVEPPLGATSEAPSGKE